MKGTDISMFSSASKFTYVTSVGEFCGVILNTIAEDPAFSMTSPERTLSPLVTQSPATKSVNSLWDLDRLQREIISLFFDASVSAHCANPLAANRYEARKKALLGDLNLSIEEIMDIKQYMSDMLEVVIPGGIGLIQCLTLASFIRFVVTQASASAKNQNRVSIRMIKGKKVTQAQQLRMVSLGFDAGPTRSKSKAKRDFKEELRLALNSESPEQQRLSNEPPRELNNNLVTEPMRIVAVSLILPETMTVPQFWEKIVDCVACFKYVRTKPDGFESSLFEESVVQQKAVIERSFAKLTSHRKVGMALLNAQQFPPSVMDDSDRLVAIAIHSITKVCFICFNHHYYHFSYQLTNFIFDRLFNHHLISSFASRH